MSRAHIIATGGTIAMAHNDQAGGAVLALSGADLLKRLLSQAGPGMPQVTAEEYGPLPSSHFTIEHLGGLRQRVVDVLAQDKIDGAVVTHGTDTLEETAYLLDLTVPCDKPVVLTGALRVASEPGYEGLANLLAAVRTAVHPDARGLGALVVMNDEIHAARDVTKTHSQATDTFQSPFWGPLGRVDADRVSLSRRVQRRVIDCPRLEPGVYLLKLAIGIDAVLLRQAVAAGARGVVIEGFGGGRVPPWWLDAIELAMAQGVAVVIATRCPAGRTFDQYGFRGAHRDLLRVGCLFADGLNGPKARLRLMAILGTTADPASARTLWEA